MSIYCAVDVHDGGAICIVNPRLLFNFNVNDVLRVQRNTQHVGYLKIEALDDSIHRGNFTISLSKDVAKLLQLGNLEKVNFSKAANPETATVVTFSFKDQYLGRSTMWNLKRQLLDSLVYVGQGTCRKFSQLKATVLEVSNQRPEGKPTARQKMGIVGPLTRFTFLSETGKLFLLVQVSSEMFTQVAGGAWLAKENLLNRFLPELFTRWRQQGVNHVVTLVLFGRVFSENGGYTDFFESVVDSEVHSDWGDLLPLVRTRFVAFCSDALRQPNSFFSSASGGNWLEANSLAINILQQHYIDRDFNRTGLLVITVTAGNGVFSCPKDLAELTQRRVADDGIALQVVSLALPALFSVPRLQFSEGENFFSVADWIGIEFYGAEPAHPLHQLSRCDRPEIIPIKAESRIPMLSTNLFEEANRQFAPWLAACFNKQTGSMNSFGANRTHAGAPICLKKSDPLKPYDEFSDRWRDIFDQGRGSFVADRATQMRWTHLIYVPCFPLEYSTTPTTAELNHRYRSYVYTIYPNHSSSNLPLIGENLMQELVIQRLCQGFQLVPSLDDGEFSLSKSLEFHQLSHSDNSCIIAKRYVLEGASESKKLPLYRYSVRSYPCQSEFRSRSDSLLSPGTDLNWNYHDCLIAGYNEDLRESLRYWRSRLAFIPMAEPPKNSLLLNPKNLPLLGEELRIAGFYRLLLFLQSYSLMPSAVPYEKDKQLLAKNTMAVQVRRTTLSEIVFENSLLLQQSMRQTRHIRRATATKGELRALLADPIYGPPLQDIWWNHRIYKRLIIGRDFCDWIMKTVDDVPDRNAAVEFGNFLIAQELVEHYVRRKSFLDGYFYYRLISSEPPPPPAFKNVAAAFEPALISSPMFISVDSHQQSKRSEWAVIHYDRIFNTKVCFHLYLNWLNCSTRYLADTVQAWRSKAQQCGFHLVEVPIRQPNPTHDSNPFIAPLEIRLTLAPPPPLDDSDAQYHCAFMEELFQRWHFILDCEADAPYLEAGKIAYSFKEKDPYAYNQYIHVSGTHLLLYTGDSNAPFYVVRNRARSSSKSGFLTADDSRLATFEIEEFRKFCLSESHLCELWQTVRSTVIPRIKQRRFLPIDSQSTQGNSPSD